ncbi:DNA-directed RNA polymerase subunit alpha [Candidatus Calescamantes bacterium]|nr:DNA-directed RNA polymerase subunit alpha [Candidatus Calescamantes bacterium]
MPEKFDWEKLTAIYGKFILEPLERGYATTIGNALRRVLLSSIPGCGVTEVKIEGVRHEFSTLEGVKEDVPEIINNLKHVIIKLRSSDSETLTIDVEEEGEVRANDIKGNENVEILNPHLHIATLSPGGRLKMEITAKWGKGFLLQEKVKKREEVPIGTIALDTVFSPVKKVNYTMENTRVGEMTDYERLLMEIWTNGVVTPQEALEKAVEILVNHFRFLVGENKIQKEVEVEADKEEQAIQKEVLNKNIDEFNLSERVINALHSQEIYTVGELINKTDKELMEKKNFGKKSLEEIKSLLKNLNLSLKK